MAYYTDQSTVYRDVVLLLLLLLLLFVSKFSSVCTIILRGTLANGEPKIFLQKPPTVSYGARLGGTSNRRSYLPLARRTDETLRAEADYVFATDYNLWSASRFCHLREKSYYLKFKTFVRFDKCFLYISLPSLFDYDVKMLNFTFGENVNTRQQLYFSFPELRYSL